MVLVVFCSTAYGQSIAYVSSSATGSGALDNPNDPFPTVVAALTAGADELRIAAGTYDGDVTIDASSVVFRTWNGQATRRSP